jgi:hypothetical protein
MSNFTLAQVKDKPDKAYTIEQATSDKAQLHTISFDGLAFLTGSFGADCFFPPGKVADFFGFQYMRDNDRNLMGHNTDFLTRIANNVISILNKDQLNKLIDLAKEQEQLYTDFAYKRMVLIKAFRQSLEGELPQRSTGLNKESVIQYCGELYAIDAELSYRRAEVMGAVIRSFTDDQKKALAKLDFGNSASWPILPETLDKRSMSHRAHVGVMTYVSELFSWYKGSVTTDVYFCPERHGTYFGGFYLKDFPAMGNHGYSISTALTGDAGKSFLDILNPEQRKLMEALPFLQKKNLDEIVKTRSQVSEALRYFIKGENVDKKKISDLLYYYGQQDGEMSWYYCNALTLINKTLSAEQKNKLKKLRNLEQLPSGTYLYSDPVPLPADIECSFLFFSPELKVQKGL